MSQIGSVREWDAIANEKTGEGDGCTARFYYRPVQDKRASLAEGRPIFKDVEYVQIFVPGEKNLAPDRKVHDGDRQRWPTAYARFKTTGEEATSGTPLREWAFLSRTRHAELEAMGVKTVEDLANTPDAEVSRLGPDGAELVRRAKQALRPESEVVGELRRDSQEKEVEISELRAAMDQMRKQVEALQAEAKPKRGPGRPRKNPLPDDVE